MQQVLRPYATAGIAVVGASLIAVTPAAATSPAVPQVRDVALTSVLGDFLAPWIAQGNTAAENATLLANNFFVAPHVALQQLIANMNGYAQQIFDDPANLPAVTAQMQQHLDAVQTGMTLINASDETTATVTLHTLSGSDLSDFANPTLGHDLLFQLLPSFLPADQAATIGPIVDYLASPSSGMLIGALGPALSPWVALINSINDGDGFNEILANMAGAYFNGATLNLDALLPLINSAGLLPAPIELTHLEFAFGGLFSTGVVGNAPYQLYDSGGDVVSSVAPVGGSIFNSLGLTISLGDLLPLPGGGLALPGEPVGPIGAMLGASQTIAGLLGGDAWNWNGKSGGTPPPAVPPLSGFSLPLIPSDFFDDGGVSNATADVAWTDLVDAFAGAGITL